MAHAGHYTFTYNKGVSVHLDPNNFKITEYTYFGLTHSGRQFWGLMFDVHK